MIHRFTKPDRPVSSRRASGYGKRALLVLLGLVAAVGLVVIGLWFMLLSPYGYTPPADAPGFDGAPAQPVFVYGTLRRPTVRRLVIGRAVDTQEASLPGFRREHLNIVPDPQARTHGEVIEVKIEELRRLDRYERLGVRYERVWLPLDDGRSAWVYRRLATP